MTRTQFHAQAQRAIVLITHRLSSVRYADQILVLDHGQFIERGTLTTLMATPGSRYRRMFNLQASRYTSRNLSAAREYWI